MFTWPIFASIFAAAIALIKMGNMIAWIIVMKMTILVMSILLIAISGVAVFLGFHKYKKD